MDSHANMTCILKVNMHCVGCQKKVMKVLQNIHGIYSFTIDGQQGMARVSGKVDPNIVLKMLAKSGKHAELCWFNLENQSRTKGYYKNNMYTQHGGINQQLYGTQYGGLDRWRGGAGLEHQLWYNRNTRSLPVDSQWNNRNTQYLPAANYHPHRPPLVAYRNKHYSENMPANYYPHRPPPVANYCNIHYDDNVGCCH